MNFIPLSALGLRNLRRNIILLTDAYNLSHQRLKVNTDWEVSHMYNRSKPMILFGLLEIVSNILDTQVTMEMIDEAEFHANRMGLKFPREIWERVVKECNGYIPLEIQTVPEGTYCPVGTPFAQIRNTVEGFGEMVTWFEGELMHAYFPSTTATQALRMRRYLEQKKRQYGYDDSFMLRLHSFGFRGHRSLEDAYWAGISWNLFLYGTDDFHTAVHTPNANITSISASAHKVVQQFDDEFEGYKYRIRATADAGEKILSEVIDTYDAYRVIKEFLVPLAHYALRFGIRLVLRPDSGDTWEQAVEIYRIVERANLTNVGVIIGEGMDFENVKKADAYFEQHGVPLNFVSYGIGGGFYNYVNRDTLGWAMKTAYSNGKDRMKFSENPIKRSIPGIVGLIRNEHGDMVVVPEDSIDHEENLYEAIYQHNEQMVSPFIKAYNENHWLAVQERALAASTEQATIYLSEEIREEIGEFQKRYRNRV